MHYLVKAEEQDDWKQPILNSPGRFVLEHMGGVDPAKGIDGDGFKFVLECLDTGRCWVKLSPRISKQENFPFSDTDPLVKKLVEHAPTRLLWGSDWPHPQYFKPMPNDVALLDMMLDWVPDEGLQADLCRQSRRDFWLPASGIGMSGDDYPTVKVAAVQAASVFLDREGSTEKACRLIAEAGRNGARVIGFPEVIRSRPSGLVSPSRCDRRARQPAVGRIVQEHGRDPGPQVAALCAAARSANAYVVIGVCEKLPNTIGTLFNTQLYIGPDGTLIRKHQKIMPTVGERLAHTGGHGDTFGAFPSEFGPMSGLICGENSNPLAVFALTAEGTRIHVMSWPNHFPVSGDPLKNRVAVDSQAFAQMSKAFVISAAGTVDERMIEMLEPGPEAERFLRSPDCCGGSVIVAPNSRILAGPMGAEEGVISMPTVISNSAY